MEPGSLVQTLLGAVTLLSELTPRFTKLRVDLYTGANNDLILVASNHGSKTFWVRHARIVQLSQWREPRNILVHETHVDSLAIAAGDSKAFSLSLKTAWATLGSNYEDDKVIVQGRIVDPLDNNYLSRGTLALWRPFQLQLN